MASLNGARVAVLEARMSAELAAMVERFGGVPCSAPAVREAPLEQPEDIGGVRRGLMRRSLRDRRADDRRRRDGAAARSGATGSSRGGARRAEEHDSRCAAVPSPSRCCGVTTFRSASRPPNRTRQPNCSRRLVPSTWPAKTVGFVHYGERNETAADGLRARGAAVNEVCLYEWRLPDDVAPLERLVDEIIDGRIDAIVITSQIQCRHLFQIADRLGKSRALTDALNATGGRRRRGTGVCLGASRGGSDPARSAGPPQDGSDDDRARRLLRADRPLISRQSAVSSRQSAVGSRPRGGSRARRVRRSGCGRSARRAARRRGRRRFRRCAPPTRSP